MLMETEYCCWPLNKLKNGSHFLYLHCTEKIQITSPSKVWVSYFQTVARIKCATAKYHIGPKMGLWITLFSISGFPQIDHSGIDARIVLEQINTAQKATSNRA